jgi:hypothetical protein
MRKLLLLFCFGLLTSLTVWGQSSINGNITDTSSTCGTNNASNTTACVVLPLASNSGAVALSIIGTYSATLQFEASANDGASWVSIAGTVIGSTSTATSATSTGTWRFAVSGLTHIRVRCSSFSSGPASVTLKSSTTAASLGGGGGGTGAVDSVFGRTGDVVAASGDYTLDQVGDPAANKAFTMGARTLNFNISSNSSTANPFSFSDFSTNTGTGYLFTVSTGSSSATKPFRVCYRGTTNCFNFDTTILTTSGSAVIDATKLSGNLPALNGSALTALNGSNVASGTVAAARMAVMLGDSGSGGTQGVVPAPASGDAAAGKFLKADATWAVPPGGGSGCVPAGSANQILTDDGAGGCASSVATLSSGNLSTAGSITSGAGGSVAGGLQLNQGTANTPGSNSIVIQAPTSVGTAYSRTLAGAAATGFPFYTNSANVETETIVSTSGSGNVVLVTSPTLVTPTLGAATATSVNKMAITAPATSSTLAVADGKTLTASNTLTLTGTDSSSVAFGAGGTVSYTIASGTSAMGTSAISSGACATAVTTGASGTATTDVIWWGFNGDPTGVTGYAPTTNGMLTIIAYPTANNVNYKVCNNTSASVTPGAITLNWRVIR